MHSPFVTAASIIMNLSAMLVNLLPLQSSYPHSTFTYGVLFSIPSLIRMSGQSSGGKKDVGSSKRTQPRSWSNFEAYIPFFRDVVAYSGLDWRTVDRGLWVLGGRLNTTMKKQNTAKPEEAEVSALDLNQQQRESCFTQIPSELMDKVYLAIRKQWGSISFRHRGIEVSPRLIKTAIELLNEEPAKVLPQNCRNDVRERTPDGLDRRIKVRLNSDLRTANIISDVLKDASIVEIIQIESARTGRMVKATRLFEEYCW